MNGSKEEGEKAFQDFILRFLPQEPAVLFLKAPEP